jgi:hypothetical protein
MDAAISLLSVAPTRGSESSLMHYRWLLNQNGALSAMLA